MKSAFRHIATDQRCFPIMVKHPRLKVVRQSNNASRQAPKVSRQKPKVFRQSLKVSKKRSNVLRKRSNASRNSPNALRQNPGVVRQSFKVSRKSPYVLRQTPKVIQQNRVYGKKPIGGNIIFPLPIQRPDCGHDITRLVLLEMGVSRIAFVV